MKKIIDFDSYQEFQHFIKENSTNEIIGYGAEGECILSKDGSNLYKVLEFCESLKRPVVTYKVDKIITVNDIDLKRYVLPSELYALDGVLVGYKAKYIKGEDLFSASNLTRFSNGEKLLDFNALISSYYEMGKETDLLSKEKIILFDLLYNILFVNNNLYGVDTCGYGKTWANVDDINRSILRKAFKEMFNEYFLYDNYISYDESIWMKEEKDMEKYFRKLEKVMSRK